MQKVQEDCCTSMLTSNFSWFYLTFMFSGCRCSNRLTNPLYFRLLTSWAGHVSRPTCQASSLEVCWLSLWAQTDGLVIHVPNQRCLIIQWVSVNAVAISAANAAVPQQWWWLVHGWSSGANQFGSVHSCQLLQSVHHPVGELLQLGQTDVHRL